MSRLKIETPDQVQLTVERLYKDLERHIIASPPGLCPVDLQLSFLKVCHAQTCGKCTPQMSESYNGTAKPQDVYRI